MKTKEFKTGDTDEQCPNCGYYHVVTTEWFEYERTEKPYSGWRFWKDTTTTFTTVDKGEAKACNECGWKDRYE